MVVENKNWIVEIGREQLLDVLLSESLYLDQASYDDLKYLRPARGKLLAIWQAASESSRSPLPQIIIGEDDSLSDLLAWGATYLRGIGPLSAQTHILNLEQFNNLLEWRPNIGWQRLAGAAVSLSCSEVLLQARRRLSYNEVSFSACRSTLSFVLMRAIALGAPTEFLSELSSYWERARRQMGHEKTNFPSDIIVLISQIFADTVKAEKSVLRGMVGKILASLFNYNQPGVTERNADIVSIFSLENPNFILDPSLTAEGRIKFFDKMAPLVIGDYKRDRLENSFVLAFLAFWCRPTFAQQIALCDPYREQLPETILWLGVIQAAASLPEALSSNNGVTWRVARELFQPDTMFSPPRADISLKEMILSRGSSSHLIKSLEKNRAEIELYPGISVFVSDGRSIAPQQQELNIEAPYKLNNDRQNQQDTLVAVERSLENALKRIRDARADNYAPRSGLIRRKRTKSDAP